MLKERTVLILGAGASTEYGYPLGSGLKTEILSKCNIQNLLLDGALNRHKGMGNNAVIQTPFEEQVFLHKDCGFTLDMIRDFKRDFGASPRGSIDAFLENRPEFLDLGKTLISMTLQGHEDLKFIIDNPNRNNWYGYLFNIVALNWDSFKENKLHVVTYNYDRSFETYFIEALRTTFGKTYNECASAFYNTINVIHVHGRVSRMIEGTSVKDYDAKVTGEYIIAGAKELKIVHEETNYTMVHQCLSEAERVFILGFGFDERNLERLKLHNYKAPIYATRKGISDLNISRINEVAQGSILFSPQRDYGIVDFFDNDASLYGYVSPHMPKQPSKGFVGR